MSAGERVALFSGGGNRSNTNASKALVEFRAGNCIYFNPTNYLGNFLEIKEAGLKARPKFLHKVFPNMIWALTISIIPDSKY